MAVDVGWLESGILGRKLSANESDLVTAIVDEENYSSGETIISSGQKGGVLHIMRSGSANVEVINDENNEKRIQLAEIKAGNLFGELTFLTNNAATADVIATQDCVVYKLPQERLVSVMNKGEDGLAYLFFSAIMERQSGVILEQRVTLAPELRNRKNSGMPIFAKVVIACVVISLVVIIGTSS